MTMIDAVPTVNTCFDSGVVLTVLDGGKLSITGNKKAPVVNDLVAMIQQDRQSVLAAIETVTMQRAAIAGWNAPRVAPKVVVAPVTDVTPVAIATPEPAPQPDLFAAAETLPKDNIQPEVVATGKTENFSDLNVATDDLQLFVGRIVSDDDMFTLYHRAHLEGARLTSDMMGKRLPCDHKVTSWRPGGVK